MGVDPVNRVKLRVYDFEEIWRQLFDAGMSFRCIQEQNYRHFLFSAWFDDLLKVEIHSREVCFGFFNNESLIMSYN